MESTDEKFLQAILEAPSPTGCEEPVAALVRERLGGAATTVETDVMGSVHATLEGDPARPSCMLSVHMDEIGLMVTYISDEGFLSFAAVAAWTRRCCPACAWTCTRRAACCGAWWAASPSTS